MRSPDGYIMANNNVYVGREDIMRKVKEYFHMIIAAIICITVRMISGTGQTLSEAGGRINVFGTGRYKETALSGKKREKAVSGHWKYGSVDISQYSPEVVKCICGPGDLKGQPPSPGVMLL